MNRKAKDLTVTFKNPKVSSSKEDDEDVDYINAEVNSEELQSVSGQEVSFIQTFLPLAACWFILLVILILQIYFTSVISENITKQTAENKNLTTELQQVKRQNQELQTDMKNLTETINILKDTSLAQWIVDAYCPKDNGVRKCTACQKGWGLKQSSCYIYNDPQPSNWRTWEGARDDCRGKGSDLTAVSDENEKSYVNGISPQNNGIKGYWIGLRAVGGEWKWIDGTNLTNREWVNHQPAADGQCVTSLKDKGWKSVSCEERNAWICEMKALSV